MRQHAAATAAVPAVAVTRGVAATEPAASPRPFGAADTAFGLDVLRAWCAQYPGQNLVFSPSTLASALGMAYLGARGATAAAMATVLHLPAGGGTALAAGLQARSDALGGLDGPGVTLSASNQVWADPSLPPLAGYLNAVATGYGAGVARAPFLTDPAKAASQVNQVISAETRGHISNLVSPGMLTDVGWVLTSALYLDAKWAAPFDPDKTQPAPFTAGRREDGHRVVPGRRRVQLREVRRLDRGLAAVRGREADDDRAAAAGRVGFLRAARRVAAGRDHRRARRRRHPRQPREASPGRRSTCRR